jgi:hypothetical protein
MKLAGVWYVWCTRKKASRVLVKGPEGRRPLGRYVCRWEIH